MPGNHKRVQLTVTARDTAAEIFLIDDTLNKIAQGVGALSYTVSPGVYKVKLKIGTQTQEQLVRVRDDQPTHHVEIAALPIMTAVPIADSFFSRDDHRDAIAERYSGAPHLELGSGSHIYLCARDLVAPGSSIEAVSHPMRALSLRDRMGTVLVDFEIESERFDGDPSAPLALCMVAVDPGLYLLHLELESGLQVDQALFASLGWHTHIYLLQRYWTPDDRAVDLLNASILMNRDGTFDYSDEIVRLNEVLRLGLVQNRPVLSSDIVQAVNGKAENPMGGLLAAHHLLLRESVGDLFASTVARLLELMPDHPDVTALTLRLTPPLHPTGLSTPPMLRHSWQLILDASTSQPDLVPAYSLNAQIGSRLLSGLPWVVWQTPDLIDSPIILDDDGTMGLAPDPVPTPALPDTRITPTELDKTEAALVQFKQQQQPIDLLENAPAPLSDADIDALLDDETSRAHFVRFTNTPQARVNAQLAGLLKRRGSGG